MVTRRQFLRWCGMGTAGTILAACAPTPSGKEKETVVVEQTRMVEVEKVITATPPPKERTTITYWHPWAGDYCDFAQKVIDDHNASQDTLYAENICIGSGNFDEKLITSIAGGNPPDMAATWSPAVPLALQGALLPLDDYLFTSKKIKEEDFYPASWSCCVFKSVVWAMPCVSGPSMIYYAKKLLEQDGFSVEQADFPTTWNGLRELSKKLTKRDSSGKITQVGFAPWKYGAHDFYAWVASNGGQIYDQSSMTFSIDDPKVVETAAEWRRYVDEIFDGDVRTADDVSWTGWNSGEAADSGWMLDQVAMVVCGHWCAREYISFDKAFQFGMAKYPVGPSGEKSYSKWWPCWWIIPKGAKHPSEAWQLIEYWESIGLKTWQRLSSDMSPRIEDATIVPDVVIELFGDKAEETWTWWTDLVKDSVSLFLEPNANLVLDKLGIALDAIMIDNANPAQVLAKAQTECTEDLQKLLKE